MRADFRFKENWEGCRGPRARDAGSCATSAAARWSSSRAYLNQHFKVGVGYNFTDFSDDLTDLSFDHRGVFLNMTGAL